MPENEGGSYGNEAEMTESEALSYSNKAGLWRAKISGAILGNTVQLFGFWGNLLFGHNLSWQSLQLLFDRFYPGAPSAN